MVNNVNINIKIKRQIIIIIKIIKFHIPFSHLLALVQQNEEQRMCIRCVIDVFCIFHYCTATEKDRK